MSLYTVSLLHPFSAKAIGLAESDLYHSHSKAQELALRKIEERESNYVFRIEYFTERWLPYSKKFNSLTKRFFPVTKPFVKGRSVWRRQHSLSHFFSPPSNLTIINMSGHGSKYCFKYAEKLRRKGLPYVPMIGGVNMSITGKALQYYQNAHHILVHTQLQQEELYKTKGFESLDIRVLPLGVDLGLFKADLSKKTPKVPRLLFVGRVIPLKRIELALEALVMSRKEGVDATLDIVGFTPDELYLKQLKDLIAQLELNGTVQFLGAVPQEQLVPLYQKASLLLLPSRHESFGMVMTEAMACGTPAASIKGSGGPEEIIKNGFNGIITSPESYAGNVASLMKDPDRLHSLQRNSVNWVSERYSINITSKILEKSLRDALPLD